MEKAADFIRGLLLSVYITYEADALILKIMEYYLH
mgnify:CR=1 FL=1